MLYVLWTKHVLQILLLHMPVAIHHFQTQQIITCQLMIWSQDSQRSSNSVCTSWVLIWIFNKTGKYFNETTDEASLEKGQRHVLTSGQGWFYNTSPVGNHFPLSFWVGRLCSHWFHNQRSLMADLLLGFVRLPEFWPGSQRQPILSLRARSTLPRHR